MGKMRGLGKVAPERVGARIGHGSAGSGSCRARSPSYGPHRAVAVEADRPPRRCFSGSRFPGSLFPGLPARPKGGFPPLPLLFRCSAPRTRYDVSMPRMAPVVIPGVPHPVTQPANKAGGQAAAAAARTSSLPTRTAGAISFCFQKTLKLLRPPARTGRSADQGRGHGKTVLCHQIPADEDRRRYLLLLSEDAETLTPAGAHGPSGRPRKWP